MSPSLPPERCGLRTQEASAVTTAAGFRRTELVSRDLRNERLTRLFKKCEDLVPADARIVLEEVLDRIAALEKVDQRINRHSGTDKHRRTAKNLRVGMDDQFRVHDVAKDTSIDPAVQSSSRRRYANDFLKHRTTAVSTKPTARCAAALATF